MTASTNMQPEPLGPEGFMVCPSCGTHDRFPERESDDATTSCPKCGHRFPVNDEPPEQ